MVQATAGNVKPRKNFFRHLEALLKSPRKFPKDPEENNNCVGPGRDFRRECSSSLLDRAPRVVKIMRIKSTPPNVNQGLDFSGSRLSAGDTLTGILC